MRPKKTNIETTISCWTDGATRRLTYCRRAAGGRRSGGGGGASAPFQDIADRPQHSTVVDVVVVGKAVFWIFGR